MAVDDRNRRAETGPIHLGRDSADNHRRPPTGGPRKRCLSRTDAVRCRLRRTMTGALITRRSQVRILPPPPCDLSRDRKRSEPSTGFGSFRFGAGWSFGCPGALVAAGRVEGEVSEYFAGSAVDDADVEIVDEQDDAGSGVGSSDADVVEAAVDAQADGAAFVDAVVTDAVVGVGAGAGCCSGSGGVGDGGCGLVGESGVGVGGCRARRRCRGALGAR